MSVKDNLKKALHKAIAKAYQNGKQKVVNAIVSDIADPNSVAQVSSKDIPATSESIMNKDVSLSELHQKKQANAMAKLGQPAKIPGAQAKPTMSATGAPKTPKMPEMGKMERPLRSFLGKKEEKRQSDKGVHVAANFQINRPGVSHAGVSTRAAKTNSAKGAASWLNVNEAKDRHKKVLEEMKQIKPKLGKSRGNK
jgi:hypothetical protein